MIANGCSWNVSIFLTDPGTCMYSLVMSASFGMHVSHAYVTREQIDRAFSATMLRNWSKEAYRSVCNMSTYGSTEYPTSTLRISNVVSYVLLIAVNVASNSGLLGPNNADISQKYSTPLTPQG